MKINIETQVFKCLQRFGFIGKERYAFKAFQEGNLVIDAWLKYMKTKLDHLGLGNLMGNIYKIISGEISAK